MYTLLNLLPAKRVLYEQLPAMTFAWIVTEVFFKFHSFTLEAGAFLAMWFALDALVQKVARPLFKRDEEGG